MLKSYDVERKADNKLGIYWGVGPTITVLEIPRFDDFRRFLCMTCRVNDCKHVTAIKRYLHITTSEATA